jgi:hypothetical protein
VSILWRKRYLINSCGIPALLGDSGPVHPGVFSAVCQQAVSTRWQAACKIRVDVCNRPSLSNDAVEGARIAG